MQNDQKIMSIEVRSAIAAAVTAGALLTVAPLGIADTNAELGLAPGAQIYAMDSDKAANGIQDMFGVEIQPLRLTAFDNMLDFRYRVLDPDKAVSLHQPQIRPFLLDPVKKMRLSVPKTKVGTFRQAKNAVPHKDRVYATLFANPGRALKRGDKITVVFGDMVLQDMKVQ